MRGFDQLARREAPKLLEKVTGLPVRVEEAPNRKRGVEGPDFALRAGDYTFLVEVKSSSAAGPVDLAVQHLKKLLPKGRKNTIPLLVVPYMGNTGWAKCLEADVSWLDLSGNARIKAPGLIIGLQVYPNRFKGKGRPSTAFAPKSSRVARWLLLHPQAPVTQREIARSTGLGEGFVSRIVARLSEEGYVVRMGADGEGEGDGTGFGGGSAPGAGEGDGSGDGHSRSLPLRVRDPALLLGAWREAYDFSKHQIIAGHIAARSSEQLLHDLTRAFSKGKIPYAVTGLAGASLYSRFAQYRLVTVYVSAFPEDEFLKKIGFRAEEQGANVWLVIPNDEGVFAGSQEREGIRCVSPLQVYLDLKGHPERAAEAAAELRHEFLNLVNHA
ncbi:MAG: type IV toxin-antitoxin system AbiEi family antitoxin [Bdellovibrionota bacterium]